MKIDILIRCRQCGGPTGAEVHQLVICGVPTFLVCKGCANKHHGQVKEAPAYVPELVVMN